MVSLSCLCDVFVVYLMQRKSLYGCNCVGTVPFATADPLIVPVNADDKTATKAAPPLILPATTFDISITKSLAPETTRKPPKIINKAMFDDEIFGYALGGNRLWDMGHGYKPCSSQSQYTCCQ